MTESRMISLQRAQELRQRNDDYLKVRDSIPKGTDDICRQQYHTQKEKLLKLLDATPEDWDSWQWQMRNRIDSLELLEQVLPLEVDEKAAIAAITDKYRWAITPYYLALVDPLDPLDPIRLMSVPMAEELNDEGEADPMAEEFTNPAGSITRRYPDRLIINTTNSCAMFCRHCQRRRRIGEFDRAVDVDTMEESIQYVRENPEVRDVLVTGGDPLTLSNSRLEHILSSLRAIPHVEIIRIGTRIPVTMPQRVDDELVSILKKYHPLYLNTQFNHPKELTPEAVAACEKLADNGISLGNQMVLLGGVNCDKYIVRMLNHEMLKARVRPYYIFHAKAVIGTLHFNTSIDEGLEIMDHLRGYTSGMAIPTYIVNAPGGYGKIPLLPQYMVDSNEDYVTLRTWEGRLVEYPNHKHSYGEEMAMR